MPFAPGTRLGPFEIRAPLDVASLGEAYRIRDHEHQRDAAMRVLPADFGADPDRLRRFEREARAAALLAHENSLTIHDIGTDARAAYIITEPIEGRTLRDALASGALPVRTAIQYGVQIARALAAAHDRGVLHRDLKPENVVISPDGRVRVAGFGLAAATQVESALAGLRGVTPGAPLGSPSYMSPEQVKGAPADARSDVFTLGAILYEMVTGTRAFAGDTPLVTMTDVAKAEPKIPADLQLPPALEQTIEQCLQKRAGARPAAATVAQDAERLETRGDAIQVGGASGGEAMRAFSLSSAGILAYQTGPPAAPGRSRLAWFDRTGLETGVVGQPADYGDVNLSANGARVAVSVRAPDMAPSDIAVVDVEGGTLTPVSSDPADDTTPIWSPDGRRLLYASARGGSQDVFQRSADGSGSDALIVGGRGDQIAYDWSADGRYLLFQTNEPKVADGGNFDLWARALPGGPSFAYFRTIRAATQPQMSPDRQWVAYTSNEDGRPDVFVSRFPRPEGRQRVSPRGGAWPRWRRDGAELFYIAPNDQLMAVPVKRGAAALGVGAPVAFFTMRTKADRGYPYDVSADCERILVNTPGEGDLARPIMLVDWRP